MATNNAANEQFTNNADGFTLGGGTTARTATVTGANITLTGSGSNTYTFPAATDTLVGRASTDTLTNKDITSTTNTYPNGFVLQSPSTNYAAVATGTTIIPFDDTIPQSTEGTEFMSQAITPRYSTSTLQIEVTAFVSASIADVVSMAIIQDTTANAIAATMQYQATVTGPFILKLTHSMTAGTTSATTFHVRMGTASAGTTTFNGQAGGRLFGAITKSNIKVTEIKG